MQHLAEQSVLDLVGGRLPQAAAVAAHAHLDSCDECRAVVAIAGRALEPDATNPGRRRALGSDATERERPPAIPATPQVRRIDEFELLELLGRGGMGAVYRARDTMLDRDVAVKLIERTGADAARERFLVEARAVARIRHRNVVVVHRVGVVEAPARAGLGYIVYDLVRGRTLASLPTPLPWTRTLELAAGMVRGLAAAHACGVLHRDLKPANIMLDELDEIVLVDFGLAKLEAEGTGARGPDAPHELSLTRSGVALGTPRYMAPETWRGLPATPQTDLYSLGLVLFELLSGHVPFAADDATSLADAVTQHDAPPLREGAPWVPPALAALVDRCLARDPAARPTSAAALGEQLEALQRGRAFEDFERDRVRRAPAGNPYVPDRPFGFEHQGVFFGRTDELHAVIDQLRDRPLVVVAGARGVGKTSLCQAGVLPLAARGAIGGGRKWVPVPVALGAQPLEALAAAIAPHVERSAEDTLAQLRTSPDEVLAAFRAGHRAGCTAHVLFVDALEALLACSLDDAACAARLLAALATPSPTLRVLATLDLDRLVDLAALPGLHRALAPAMYLLVAPRDPSALRELAFEPARLTGRRLDDARAHAIVERGARGELGLAAMQRALAALWDDAGA